MINIQITLGYAIIHLISVIYIFNMFDYNGYIPDKIERIIVWVFAPEILIMTLIRVIGGDK